MLIAKVAKPKITQARLLEKWCANPDECLTLASHYERHMSNKEYNVMHLLKSRLCMLAVAWYEASASMPSIDLGR